MTLEESLETHFRREEGFFPCVSRLLDSGAPGSELLQAFLHDETDDDLGAHAKLRAGAGELLGISSDRMGRPPGGRAAGRLCQGFDLFRTIFELHTAKEDDLIFPMIESALSPTEREAALQRLRALPLENIAMPNWKMAA